jgi:hypothetical protein
VGRASAPNYHDLFLRINSKSSRWFKISGRENDVKGHVGTGLGHKDSRQTNPMVSRTKRLDIQRLFFMIGFLSMPSKISIKRRLRACVSLRLTRY